MGPGAPPDALLPAQGDSLLPPEGPGNQHFSLSSHQHGRRLVLLVSSPGCFWNVLSKPGLAKKPLSGEPQVLAIEAYRTAGGGATPEGPLAPSASSACRWEAACRRGPWGCCPGRHRPLPGLPWLLGSSCSVSGTASQICSHSSSLLVGQQTSSRAVLTPSHQVHQAPR